MQQRLEAWKGRCAVCIADAPRSYHIISQCHTAAGQRANQERVAVQRSIRYSTRVICFKCGVPSRICQRWSTDGTVMEPGRDCQFFGVIFGVVFGIKHGYPEIWRRWQQQQAGLGEGVQTGMLVPYLGQGRGLQGLGYSRVMQAFMELTEQVQQEISFRKDRSDSNIIE